MKQCHKEITATSALTLIGQAGLDFPNNAEPVLEPLATGHVPLDTHVTPMDNSGSHESGVSRTNTGCEGFVAMTVYLGRKGCCLELGLREGKPHCQ